MELTTGRLLLRDFVPGDRAVFLAYQADPRLAAFGPGEWGPEQALGLLELFLRWQAERPRQNYQLAIVERAASPGLIGCCGVRSEGCESGVAEFGLELAPASWGRGLATEAARALLGFAFQDLGLRVIVGTSVTQNERVARLVEKLGFRSAGTLAGPDWMRARGWSQTEWRLTAEQWKEAPAPREQSGLAGYGLSAEQEPTVEPGTAGGAVRRLAVEDVGQLQALRREALLSHPLAFGSTVETDRTLDPGLAASMLGDPGRSAVFGAFLDAAPGAPMLGMVGVQRPEIVKRRHRAQIWGMYVAPRARGRGLGRLLLAAAVDQARSWPGVVQVHLSVTGAAPAAMALYERAGFRVWGREPRSLLWEEESTDEYHLVLPLDGP